MEGDLVSRFEHERFFFGFLFFIFYNCRIVSSHPSEAKVIQHCRQVPGPSYRRQDFYPTLIQDELESQHLRAILRSVGILVDVITLFAALSFKDSCEVWSRPQALPTARGLDFASL
jgi:hypothetical protein